MEKEGTKATLKFAKLEGRRLEAELIVEGGISRLLGLGRGQIELAGVGVVGGVAGRFGRPPVFLIDAQGREVVSRHQRLDYSQRAPGEEVAFSVIVGWRGKPAASYCFALPGGARGEGSLL